MRSGASGRVERTPGMLRLALYSPLLSPFGTRKCHKIQPCILGSLPLPEACLRFSRTSLFIRSFTRWDGETPSDPVPVAKIGVEPRYDTVGESMRGKSEIAES